MQSEGRYSSYLIVYKGKPVEVVDTYVLIVVRVADLLSQVIFYYVACGTFLCFSVGVLGEAERDAWPRQGWGDFRGAEGPHQSGGGRQHLPLPDLLREVLPRPQERAAGRDAV